MNSQQLRGAPLRAEVFGEFLPTACFPNRETVMVLSGAPDNVEIEAVALKWATAKAAPNEEILLAFKTSNLQFKIIRQVDSRVEEKIFDTFAST